MKKLISILLLLVSMSVNAQTSDYCSRGYHGDIALGLYGDINEGCPGFSLSTTHGMQFNRYLFVGGGIDISISDDAQMLPIYAAVRSYFIPRDMRVNPLAELRVGVDALNAGCYISPSIGFTIPIKGFAISGALAYACDIYYEVYNIGLRVGFHF